jgi:hypothetical protein
MGKQIEKLANDINDFFHNETFLKAAEEWNENVKNSEVIQGHFSKMKDMVLSQQIIYLCDILPDYIKRFSQEGYQRQPGELMEYSSLYCRLMDITIPLHLEYDLKGRTYLTEADTCEEALLNTLERVKNYISNNAPDEEFALMLGVLYSIELDFQLKYI